MMPFKHSFKITAHIIWPVIDDKDQGLEVYCVLCVFNVKDLGSRIYLIITGEKAFKFEEVLPIYQAVSKETDSGTFADFMEGFKTFDREGQGFITSAELRFLLANMGM